MSSSSRLRLSADGFVRRLINLPNSVLGGFSRAVNQSIDNLIGGTRRSSSHHNHHQPPPVSFPFQNPPATSWAQEEWAFLASFERQNGTFHPFFYACRFVDALEMSRGERKLMFVYIHSPEEGNPFVGSFCRDALCSEVVVQFLDANFVSWGGLCDRGEGLHMAGALKAGSFPFCAVVAPCSGDGNLAVMQQIEGPVSADELVEILQRTIDERGSALGPERCKKEAVKTREDRRVREEQDAAYSAALKIDQERESRLKNIPIEEGHKLSKSTKKAETSSKPDKVSHSGKRNAAEETRILIRFPNGERKEQSFSCKDKIEAIYRYVDSLEMVNNAGAGSYRLISNFPRKVYGEMKLSLKEAGLHPKASLLFELL